MASFFAVARFDAKGQAHPCEEGMGVMYRVDWRRFTEPFRYFTSITHSPASRPGRQHAWSIALNREVDFDSQEFVERFDFVHSRSESDPLIGSLASHLLPFDSIADVAQTLKNCPGVTLAGIKFALERDGCPVSERERWLENWGERLCNGLGLDVYLDEEFALTEEQIEWGKRDAELARKTFLSQVGFRVVRTLRQKAPD